MIIEPLAPDVGTMIAVSVRRMGGARTHRLREGGTIEGQATLRGVTRPIRFQLAPATCPAPGSACPLHAEGEVNRSLFGMDAHRVALGDRVRLSFSVMLDPASDQGTLP